jgi:isoamylase
MAAPPLIRDIAKHPVLSKVHLIAEPWDLGMYQVRWFSRCWVLQVQGLRGSM